MSTNRYDKISNLCSSFSGQYFETMLKIWSHPKNDQRPAVLKWLKPIVGRYTKILDIGAGDAYYLEALKPTSYTFVEPNKFFIEYINKKTNYHNIAIRHYHTVSTLLDNIDIEAYDVILMIHVLLYLEFDEIQKLLPIIKHKPIIMVHPYPLGATTIKFERTISLSTSEKKVYLKQELLGKPESLQIEQTHLSLPIESDLETLAFLVAHRTLDGLKDDQRIAAARSFVVEQLSKWRKQDGYYIPQHQVMEYYNINKINFVTPEKH